MSKPNTTPPSSSTEPESLHQAFSWLPTHHRNEPTAEFYALAKDVCLGIQTCIELVHFSMMDRDSGDARPLLNIRDTERLLRLAGTSSQMLAEAAALRIDGLNRLNSRVFPEGE
ncbi:hypothetical protein RGU75_16840 [Glaciimonas sp. CA11.2]|uniref:hypothetical protein n=1 Tax=Glaciimonas sp. CA11.2 TaxID=3048601 RepID=UPI002AB5883E|nr:hypothetical protein [Glaciimonas sp. CA11.2]MDY7547890.1 hypothetical protein [Glaciimonas sp. CA11.2]